MGERTGSRVLQWVWSYVIMPEGNKLDILELPLSHPRPDYLTNGGFNCTSNSAAGCQISLSRPWFIR
ncbi:hypothetical protein CTRU02_202392 [Colletotrichum truncatum]|uniref:Uncharacterized protein n=1 Tax=Colletotrichum truncatum TaxID=5467 RepID=A0ACC3ZKB6_COLTU